MSLETQPLWSEAVAPFAVLLSAAGADDAVVVQSAGDANQATVVFHDELNRLRANQISGQLLLVRRDQQETRTLLSQPLR